MLKGAIVHFQLEVIMKHCSTAMLSHGDFSFVFGVLIWDYGVIV